MTRKSKGPALKECTGCDDRRTPGEWGDAFPPGAKMCVPCGGLGERNKASPARTIVIQPDTPALLAARLVRRLVADGWIKRDSVSEAIWRADQEQATEALADEIHQATLDGTLGGGSVTKPITEVLSVDAVLAAYEKTGRKPIYGWWTRDGAEEPCGCPAAVVILARGGSIPFCPTNREMADTLGVSCDDMVGFTTGFDGQAPAGTSAAHEHGKAVRAALGDRVVEA